MKARLLRCTPDEYFGDPCVTPSLSSSIACELVAESPLHAWTHHPRLGGERSASTKAKDDGSLMHRLILGKGREIAIIDAPDFRTNRAKDLRDQAISKGHLPVLQYVYAEKLAIAEKIRDRCLALGYEFDGSSEVAVEFTDGNDVLCRCMWDHAWVDRGRLVDLKKVRSANPRHLARYFVEYGYDIQWAAYTRALARLVPEFEGEIDFTFLFCEIEPPYEVFAVRCGPGAPPPGVAALDEDFCSIGTMRWEQALRVWKGCLEHGKWPGFIEGTQILSPPRWVRIEHLGDEDLDMSGVGLEAA